MRIVAGAMASNAPITAAVVGGGVMGAFHVRALLDRPDVEAVVLVEPSEERRALLERRHGRLRSYPSLDAALERERLDCACVAVPPALAPELASALIEREVPVLLEKPMAPTVAEAEPVVALAEERGVLLSVGYIERFNPAVEALRGELANGVAGRVLHMHARRLSPLPTRDGLANLVKDSTTHDLDVMCHLLGGAPQRAYAEMGANLVCASVRWEDDVTGLVETNWLTPMKIRRLTVTAEGGMFEVDYLTQDLFFHEQPRSEPHWETLGVVRGANEGRMIRYALDRREPLAVEWERFIAALRDGGPAPVPGREGLNALALAEAIIASARTATPVAPEGLSV